MQFSVTNGNNVHEYNKIPTEGNELILIITLISQKITIYKQ